jgi:hypothetical protein
MEDEKEDFSDRTFVSAESRKNSSGSFRNNDEMDRAIVMSQTPDGVSFLLSRLPDQEKLDSILEHQAELEKQDLNQQQQQSVTGSVRTKLTLGLDSGSHYFSEPDLTPVTSPVGSRPPSPVLSDSELEVQPRVNLGPAAGKQEEQSWEWGKLPTTSSAAALKEIKEPAVQQPGENEIIAQGPESGHGLKGGEPKPVGGEGSAGWGLSYLWRGRQKSEKSSGNNQVRLEIILTNIRIYLKLS